MPPDICLMSHQMKEPIEATCKLCTVLSVPAALSWSVQSVQAESYGAPVRAKESQSWGLCLAKISWHQRHHYCYYHHWQPILTMTEDSAYCPLSNMHHIKATWGEVNCTGVTHFKIKFKFQRGASKWQGDVGRERKCGKQCGKFTRNLCTVRPTQKSLHRAT